MWLIYNDPDELPDERFVGLSEVLPVVEHHLSAQKLALLKSSPGMIDWGVEPGAPIRNAICSFKLLAYGFEEDQAERSPPTLERIQRMCPVITRWITFFWDATRVLDKECVPIEDDYLLGDVQVVLGALMESHPIRQILRKAKILFPISCTSGYACPSWDIPTQPAL